MADRGSSARNENVAACYRMQFPDVLELKSANQPGISGSRTVGLDGAIEINGERVRVEGQTAPEVARRIANACGCAPKQVQVHVAEFHSQHVYLFGPGISVQRAVAYQGPETVMDLLQRTGGVAPGAAPNDAYVVRPRIGEDKQPEIFHIDLKGILVGNRQQTNIRLQPFDQVFIGETRQASFQKCVPPCLRPVYEAMCGLARP